MSTLFAEISAAIAEARALELEPLIVFDLDGTLYDNLPRTLRLIREFAHTHAVRFSAELERVEAIGTAKLEYRVRDSLGNAGITDEAFIKGCEDHWFSRFFTDDAVMHDLPVAGAPEFVRAVHRAGAIPAYLTGRDAPNMLIGTLRCLQRDGFPVGTVDTRVILKDKFETPDEPYKRSVVDHLRRAGRVVAVFDNEPGLCNMFKEAFPAAVVSLLDTRCAPNSPALRDDVHRLPDFRGLLP